MDCCFNFKGLQKQSVKNVSCLMLLFGACVFLHFFVIRDLIVFINNLTTAMKQAGKQLEALNSRRSLTSVKYKRILLWNPGMAHIKSGFLKCNFSVSNYILIQNNTLINPDYTSFDAIVFNEYQLENSKEIPHSSPKKRSRSQIYIFTSIESSANFPACELYNDDFFNWTFTFRLDSDVVWNFFVVRNISGDIVAPSRTVQWDLSNYPINYKIKSLFQGRTRAAAWIVSNCRADSLRNDYLTRLHEHLYHFGLAIDVYGKCTKRACDNDDCDRMLRNKYYFYMAFENSFADDYVTEKVSHGYDNYVVPIVFGGANYTRFLPTGSYINAREFHPYNLAYIIHQAIKHPKVYEAYFHWTNLYTIDSDLQFSHPVCNLCKALNGRKAKYAPAKKKFRIWWNSLNGMKWCLPNEYWNETSKINVDGSHIYKTIY